MHSLLMMYFIFFKHEMKKISLGLPKKKRKELGERPCPNNIWFCADCMAAYGIHLEMINSHYKKKVLRPRFENAA